MATNINEPLNSFDLTTLADGEIVEVATKERVYFFERIGNTLRATDSSGAKIAEQGMSSLKINPSSIIEADGKLMLPSHNIVGAEPVLLIRAVARQVLGRR